MSTLTRRSSGNRVPDYKDYMSFVSAYRNGKKEADPNDEQNFIISTNNTRNIVAGAVNVKPCDSYSSFLEKTKSKKFSSVKPPSIPGESNEPPSKHTVKVKTEIFLEINDEIKETPNRIEFIVKEENLENTEDDAITFTNGQVEARKKMFEVRNQQENKHINTNGQNQKNKILTVKQRFESTNNKTNEENSVSFVPKEQTKKINKEKLEAFLNHHKIETNTETKLPIKSDKKIEMNSTNSSSKKDKEMTMTDGSQDPINFHIIEKRQNELQADITSKEKLIGQLNETLKFKTSISLEPEEEKTAEVSDNIFVKKVLNENFSIPPPPPPPMPNGFRQAPTINRIVKKTNQETCREKDNGSPSFINSISNSLIQDADLESSKRVSPKSHQSSTLERTNPLVRKLAYGAMLDMYGAYHEKANSYVSTLPRHHVKKDNGLQKIIDSIAAQGGLDKLSGRSNPKAENE